MRPEAQDWRRLLPERAHPVDYLHDAFFVIVVASAPVTSSTIWLWFLFFLRCFFVVFLLFSAVASAGSLVVDDVADAPRSVAIATARYQLAFWLAEDESCPPESGEECGRSRAEVLTRRSSREREKERKKKGNRESQSDDDGVEGKKGECQEERRETKKREGEVYRRIQHAGPFSMADVSHPHAPSRSLITARYLAPLPSSSCLPVPWTLSPLPVSPFERSLFLTFRVPCFSLVDT